jgi:hypothetical protein
LKLQFCGEWYGVLSVVYDVEIRNERIAPSKAILFMWA